MATNNPTSKQTHTILIAPLNWGLGHASRCVPVIRFLQSNGYQPVIASDGAALEFLKQEFPSLPSEVLPSYNVKYTKNGSLLRWKLLGQFFSVRKAVKKEHELLKNLIKKHQLIGVISDNRFGMYNKSVPSIYISHQLTVYSGITTFFTTWVHRKILSNYTQCWVPDLNHSQRLSGRLSIAKNLKIPVKFLGILSRFKKEEKPQVNTLLILLSGPEPQRTIFEQLLVSAFEKHTQKVLFVRGILHAMPIHSSNPNIQFVDFLRGKELQDAINSSEMVLARPGYSTIMDMAALGKKAFFVPTPGQTEQEYLARSMQKRGIAPFCTQHDFTRTKLRQVHAYKGFAGEFSTRLNSKLLEVFNVLPNV